MSGDTESFLASTPGPAPARARPVGIVWVFVGIVVCLLALTVYSAHLEAAGMPPDQVHAVLDRMLSVQANMLATNDVFWLCACLMIILIPVIWLARPPFGRPSLVAAD